MVLSLLAYAYTQPFLQPMPLWDWWYLLLLPLCAAVAIVYKSVKCASMKTVPREAAEAAMWIVLAMIAAGMVLVLIVKAVEWWINA